MKAVRPGDWLVIAAGLLATAATAAAQWGRGAPAMAQVRLDGRIVAELPLTGTHRIALDGALVSIRRFGSRPLTVTDYYAKKSVVPEIMQFLAACVHAEMNMV
ncbi:MAG: hypothetical protein Q8O08_07735, partial [Methyloversatilis sp.]|uniref:hypothetical protein n=1 Tax=Methyloversatilis sp. TaxID=2569862 RepID=UPI00273340D0